VRLSPNDPSGGAAKKRSAVSVIGLASNSRICEWEKKYAHYLIAVRLDVLYIKRDCSQESDPHRG
jgi:hypothetical protein